ncbi:Protein of unknown function [Spirosomataceae bacterium TFI 002]|nr:Protein of unknown function [Spirosomataceae bacterium TFI 002]
MRKSIIQTSLVYGLLAGFICVVFFIALYIADPNPLSLRRPDLGINIIFIFTSIYAFKKKNGGILHFYEGFSVGFLTNIIAALFTGISIFLFLTLYDEAPLQAWIESGIEFLKLEKENSLSEVLTDETFNSQIVSLQNAKPYQIILDELMFKQIGIIAISLCTLAMRKHQNP